MHSFSPAYTTRTEAHGKPTGLEVPYPGKAPGWGMSGPYANHPAKPRQGDRRAGPIAPQTVRGPAEQRARGHPGALLKL